MDTVNTYGFSTKSILKIMGKFQSNSKHTVQNFRWACYRVSHHSPNLPYSKRVDSPVAARLLSSWPLGEILTGSVHIRVTYDTLSVDPEPWSSKFWEWMKHGILSLSALFASASWCFEILSTHLTKPTESNWLFTLKKLFFSSYWNLYSKFNNALQ